MSSKHGTMSTRKYAIVDHINMAEKIHHNMTKESNNEHHFYGCVEADSKEAKNDSKESTEIQKQRRHHFEFPKEQSSNHSKGYKCKIKGLTRNVASRYLTAGGIGVCHTAGMKKALAGRRLCRQNHVSRITVHRRRATTQNADRQKLLIRATVKSDTKADTQYDVAIFFKDILFVDNDDIRISSSRNFHQSNCSCPDHYGDLPQNRDKCKHVAAVLEALTVPYVRDGMMKSSKEFKV